MDDLRLRIDRAVEDVERINSSLIQIDALKTALGDANSQLTDNADRIGQLARATETFRSSVERATEVLASLAEELSAADAVQIGKAISGSEANLKEVIEAKSAGVQDRLGMDLADVLSRLKSGLMQLDNGQERLLKEVKQSTAKVTELVEVLSRVVVDQQTETRERFGETSRRLDVMLAELREVAHQSARTRTKWMVALVGINVISASAVAVLMVVLLG